MYAFRPPKVFSFALKVSQGWEATHELVMGILSETRKPNQNRTEKTGTETGPKITKTRTVPIFLNPKNRNRTGTEPRTERVPEYFEYIKKNIIFNFNIYKI